MTKDLGALVSRYQGTGIFVDTNLLLLWLIGAIAPDRVANFKRTDKFEAADFHLLDRFLGRFQVRVTTPNVLTEVSSLANSLSGETRAEFAELLSRVVRTIDERYVESASITNVTALEKFGLTDCGILSVASGPYLLLTDDFRLANLVNSRGGDAINFAHLQSANWRR